MNKKEMFWQTYLNLENDLLELSKHIFITDEILLHDQNGEIHQSCNTQLETFSPYIADLLISTCVEIEAISKELYFEYGGKKSRVDNSIRFDEDCLKLIDIKCKTHKKVVLVVAPSFNLTKEENTIIKPLKEAHKRQGTYWERAYQAVKHDRYFSLHKATVKALLHAMAALYLLNIYNRNINLSSKYIEYRKLDMSFGSKIFTLKLPDEKYVIDVVNGKEITQILESTDSPYILKYTDSTYKEVIKANKNSANARAKYLMEQPEMQEQEFIKYLEEAKTRQEKNPSNKLIVIWELCKYRLNKKVPKNLPFEQRKNLFINTSEWNGYMRQQNNHKKANELTPENIQAEIDNAGILAGIELNQIFENIRFNKAFNEGYCELILDNGSVKYKDK